MLLDELNDRPLKKLGVSRRALYEQLDRPALRPLPADRYVLAQWKRCRVNIDYHVLVERHAYSVPFQLLRQQVEIRYTTATIEVFFKGRRVTSHPRRYDGKPSTLAKHMPSAHRAHAEWTPSRLIRWAEKAGPRPASSWTASCEAARTRSRGTGPSSASCAWGGSTATTGSTPPAPAPSPSVLAASTASGTSSPPARTGCPSSRPPRRHRHPHDNIRGAAYYAATTREDPC